MANRHNITVVRYEKIHLLSGNFYKFALFNNGEICGDRLWKGWMAKTPKATWPFKEEIWNLFNDRSKAEVAAKKLQAFLDKVDPPKAPK